MLSKFELHPSAERKNTSVIQFDVGETPVGSFIPLKPPLEFEYNHVNTRRSRMEHVGSWPGMDYLRELLVHVEFDIIAEDTATFTARRRSINDSFWPADPTAVATIPTLGTLVLRFDGDTEDIQADYTLDGDPSIPIDNVNYAQCSMTLVIPDGFFTGVTTPANIYYPK